MQTPLSRQDLLNLERDRAYAEAETLRREALADFWRVADAVLATTAGQALRAARRLAGRLQRHQAARSGLQPLR